MATAIATTADSVTDRRDAFMQKVIESARGAFTIFGIYLGDRLGFYEALAAGGPMTAGELATRTGTHSRYVREWLEQQTVSGILEVLNPEAPAAVRRFRMPAGVDEVLSAKESLNYMAPLAQCLVAVAAPIKEVLTAYRTGKGVDYEKYGADGREGIARVNRAAYLKQLGQEWIPVMTDVCQRLQSDPPARVADIGCGYGYSSIGLAQAFPRVRVDGFDSDAGSIESARVAAREGGVSDRVRFRVQDASDPELAGQYDLVMALECVHDMSDPVGGLRTMRRLAKPGGTVFVMDERVGDTFTPAGDDVETLNYGFSIIHCLPVGMCGEHPAGTGTVMRLGTFRSYAQEAGFRDVEVLPIDHFLWRFYRLR